MITFMTVGGLTVVICFIGLEIKSLMTEAVDETIALSRGGIDKVWRSRNRYLLRWYGLSDA